MTLVPIVLTKLRSFRSRMAPPMTRFSSTLLLLVSLCLLGCSREFAELSETSSSDPALGIGDTAPLLNIGQWVNGEPQTSGFAGNVHVVEFWATWCGPCLASMPHMSQLQEQYGDAVTFIGVTNEDYGTIEAFLASESPDGRSWGDAISYRLAIDNNGATNVAYMKAANQNGIPTAFIVGRDGKIKWIGHPGGIDDPLRQVVEGA